MQGYLNDEHQHHTLDAERLTFPQVLHRACSEVAAAANGSECLLFLYDDVAETFAVAGVHGNEMQAALGMVPAPDDEDVLANAMQDVRPVGAMIHDPRSGNALTCTLVPLWDLVPVGVAALMGTNGTTETVSADVYSAARNAAHAIRKARPDVDHVCLFRGILEIDPGGIAVVEGPEHVFSYATQAFRQVANRSAVPFLGRRARDVLERAADYRGIALLDQVRNERRPVHVPQVELVDAYGARYYELHMVPEDPGTGASDSIYIILWPRTDVVLTRRALEDSIQQLGNSQSVLSAVLDGTNNGIVFIDKDRIVQYANRRAGDLLGLQVQQMVGHHVGELIAGFQHRVSNPEVFRERALSLFDTMEESSEDLLEIRVPGRRLLDRYGAPVYSETGSLLGRVEVYSDVTETRDLQRSKDDFLSLVSHELKTPVTSIKGYSQLLKRRATRENLSEGILNACTVIERQVERMEGLIDTLLDLSRLETGRLDLDFQRVDLRALVLRIGELTQVTEEAHVIELDVPPAPVWIEADAGRLEQVMTNLVTNAVRFSAPGSNVLLSLREGDPVELRVVDEGQGIPEAMQPHIFERFYRGGDVQHSNGMGIGLYITHGIVEQHSGTITVDSSEGKGAIFRVTLPKIQPERPSVVLDT